MPDIFLSYSREDAATARRFADGFEHEGLEVWWDATLKSGEAYDQVTERALRDAKAVVVLWSRHSVESRWVRAEATLADRNRTLVPAMIEACERPIMFELTQTAELAHWGGDPRDKAWVAFVGDVQRFVNARREARKPPEQSAPSAGPPLTFRIGPDADQRPSLAILPFTNRSGQPADDVFADGMVEDLISAISLSGMVRVIAQNATLGYRRNASDLRAIGHELGVRYLLEGNVRRVGAVLRVSAQLVEASNGAILWTQRFDRPLSELADLQEEMVTDVSRHLGVQIDRIETERALRKPGDLTAWEAVRRSFARFERLSREGAIASIAEARKAVEIAPDYAQGHAALACAISNYFYLWDVGDKTLPVEALVEADRALSLSPGDPVVVASVANTYGNCGRWNEALTYARRATELNPGFAIAHHYMAQACLHFKRLDEAIFHAEMAARLTPQGSWNYFAVSYRGLAHFSAGRYEAALADVEHALVLNPGFVYALKDKVVCCAKLGRMEEARDTVRRLRSTDPAATLEQIEAAVAASFIAPDVAADMNAAFRAVWNDSAGTP